MHIVYFGVTSGTGCSRPLAEMIKLASEQKSGENRLGLQKSSETEENSDEPLGTGRCISNREGGISPLPD